MRTMLCLVGSPGTLLRSTRQDKKLLGRHDTGQNHVYPNRTMVPKLLRAAHSDAAARELRAPCSLVGNRPPCSLLRFFGKRVRENAAASALDAVCAHFDTCEGVLAWEGGRGGSRAGQRNIQAVTELVTFVF